MNVGYLWWSTSNEEKYQYCFKFILIVINEKKDSPFYAEKICALYVHNKMVIIICCIKR